jgi:MSHA pilin protein MshD
MRTIAGFTLIEMIIAIVIIGVGLAGVLTAFDVNVRNSADPLIRKQMLSIAEEMLEEIQLKPFSDPQGDAAPVNATANCNVAAGTVIAGAVRTAFDDVRDYGGFDAGHPGYATAGICDIDGTAIAGLGSYNVAVAITAQNLTDGTTAVASLRIAVTVTHGAETLTHFGWRTDYGS